MDSRDQATEALPVVGGPAVAVLRKEIGVVAALARRLFEQQFTRCGGRMPADPTWDDLDPAERDDYWDRALDAKPLLDLLTVERDEARAAERERTAELAEEAYRRSLAGTRLAATRAERNQALADLAFAVWLHAEARELLSDSQAENRRCREETLIARRADRGAR